MFYQVCSLFSTVRYTRHIQADSSEAAVVLLSERRGSKVTGKLCNSSSRIYVVSISTHQQKNSDH